MKKMNGVMNGVRPDFLTFLHGYRALSTGFSDIDGKKTG